MKKVIEKEVEKLIEQLKPEIRKRFVFRFSDDLLKENKNRIVLANTMSGMKPPLITFFNKTIGNHIRAQLKEIISHEIIHTFTKDERDAYGKQGKLKFFKTRKNYEKTSL